MPAEPPTFTVRQYLTHAASVAALPADTREFFLAHGYTLARLARRNRVSGEMMSAFFQGRTVSRRLVRNLGKLRAQLAARVPEAPHAQAH